MMEAMAQAKAKYGKEYVLAGNDGVHPGPNGHLVMAYAFLKGLGCKGEIGTITVDLKGSATATDGHKILSNSSGSVEVESTRYPFCFTGDPKQATTRSAIDFIPFNNELNRYILVVKNATAPRLKITWGKESKVYPAADLEKGINLAAEFIDNPFQEAFFKVERVMQVQQNFETQAHKVFLHGLIDWTKTFPEETATFESLAQKVIGKGKAGRADMRASIVRVKHTIKIEAAM